MEKDLEQLNLTYFFGVLWKIVREATVKNLNFYFHLFALRLKCGNLPNALNIDFIEREGLVRDQNN